MRKIRFLLLLLFLFLFIENGIFSPTPIPLPLPGVSVGADGKANFGIGIELPPGTQDIVPSLGVSYNSGGGNGLLGVGWSLSGLHFISRDPSFGIKYDGTDHFVSTLGGAMISANGYYYHKKENYFRIQAFGACGSGPCYFFATDPSGTTYTFGNTTDSRIEAISSSLAPANSVRVWALNEVRDTFGNSYTISYLEENGSYYPNRINYNNRAIVFSYQNKPEATGNYTYGSLVNENKRIERISIQVDGSEFDKYEFTYSNDSFTKRSLLKKISRKNYNDLSFTYPDNSFPSSALNEKTVPGLSLISQFRNPLRDTSPPGSTAAVWEHHVSCVAMAYKCTIRDLPVCLPPVSPYYVSPCLSAGEKVEAASVCDFYVVNVANSCVHGKNIEQTKWWLVDIDGDGAMDFVNLHGSQDSGAFSAGVTRKLASTPSSLESSKTFNLDINSFTGVGDMNGDRKTDFIYSKPRTAQVITGYGQLCTTVPNDNGKGSHQECRDDLNSPIYSTVPSGSTLAILFSNGTGFDIEQDTDVTISAQTPHYWNEHSARIPNIFLGDLNGDGLTDVVEEIGSQLNISLAYLESGLVKFHRNTVAISPLGGSFKQLTDIDGDGRAEYISISLGTMTIVFFDTTNPAAVTINILSPRVAKVDTASVYDPQKTNMNDVVDYPYDGLHWLADVNGDGKLDYVFQKDDKRNVCVNLFDGKSFGSEVCSNLHVELPYRDFKKSATLADTNGDGMADYVFFDGTNIKIAISDGRNFTLSNFTKASGEFYGAADLNGDGISDFLAVKMDPGSWAGTLRALVNPPSASGTDLLTIVSNGKQSVDVEYKPKSSIAGAIPSGGVFPIIPDGSPEFIATKITLHPNGGLSDRVQTFTFKGKRSYAGTADVRTDLGFETMEVKDETTGFTSITTYDQTDYRLAGIAKSSVSYNASGQKTAESNLTNYKAFTTPWGTYTPRVYGSTSKEYKNGNLMVTKTSSIPSNATGYDVYGNVLLSTNTIGANTIKTENAYSIDSANWLLNRIKNSKKYSNDIPISEQEIEYSGNIVTSMKKKVNDSQWATTSFTSYDSFGNPTEMKDAIDGKTTIVYDPVIHKFPIEITNDKGHKVQSTYDLNTGNVLTKTDQNNATTVNAYDSLGRLIEVKYPGSSSGILDSGWNESYEYNDIGIPSTQNVVKKVREVTSGVILQTTQFLDGLGRVKKKESSGEGAIIVEDFTYNTNGTLESKTLPYMKIKEQPKKVSYFYDTDLSVNEVSYPDGRTVKTSNTGLTFTVEEFSGVTSLSKLVEVKNVLGQTISKTTQGLTTSYAYDNAGRVASISSPEGGLTTISYDFSGKKISQTDKNSGTTTYQYDVAGNLISQTDAKGNIITIEYDKLGRPTRKVKPEGEISYTYDENNYLGKLTKVVDDSGTTTLQYDSVGRMIERKTETDSPVVIFRYKYDTLNRMTKMYYPDKTAVNSVFAPSGHLNQITMDARDESIMGSPVVTYELDLENEKHIFRRITGNAVTTDIEFDQVTHRPNSYLTKTKAGLIADNVLLNYDAKGNITKVEDLKSGSMTMNYVYDALNRLTSSQRGLETAVNYQYSPSGNLLQKGNIAYTYNSSSQPNAVKTAAVDNGTFTNTYHYVYDANGNMTRRNGANSTLGDKMTYDSENRLTKIEDEAENKIAEYFYDQGGQRSKKVLKDGSIVYEFGGIFEIAIPAGKPQQQTIYVRGLQGEIVAQMTDPAATLVTSAEIEDNERYALNNVSSSLSKTATGIGSLFISINSTFKHFINRHVVLNSKLLFQDHASLSYILGGNRLSDKTRITVILLFLGLLFYLAFLSNRKYKNNRLQLVAQRVVDPLPDSYQEPTRYNPFITFSTPLVLTMFLMTFSLGGCMGLSNHSNQTPWGALGVGAITANTPTLGAGSSTGGFGTPGQGGGSTGSGSSGEGTPVAGMYFFHNDQIGSTRLMTDASGELVAGSNGATDIVYNPYGDIDVDHSHGPDILRNKFTGQQLDNESGLYYYNARYYDPALGRFITADSVTDAGGEPDGMNPYMYVSGNPVRFNDPSGHIKSSELKRRIIQDFTSAVLQDFASKSTDNKLLVAAWAHKQKQQAEKKAARQEWTNAVIAVVVFAVAIYLSVVFINPAIATMASNFAVGVTGFTSGALFTTVQFVASVVMGSIAGAGLGVAGGALGGAMAQGFNGTDDYNRGKALGETAAGVGNAVSGLWESTKAMDDYEAMADESTLTIPKKNDKGDILFKGGKQNAKGVWSGGKMQTHTFKTTTYSPFPAKTFQMGKIEYLPSSFHATKWKSAEVFVKDMYGANLAQDQLTKAALRSF